jgi:hypothetical protein
MVQAGTQAQSADQVLDLADVEALVQVGRAEALDASRSAIAAFPRPSPASALIRSVSAGSYDS